MMEIKYRVKYSTLYKKQRKLLIKRGYDITLLDDVVIGLAKGEALPEKFQDHALKGRLKGFRDCHIRPDWVLVYKIEEEILTLLLVETGTHADLFSHG